MASEHRRSAFVDTPCPTRSRDAAEAKSLLRAALTGEPDPLQRIRALQPKPPSPDALKLADAQLVVARGYGFESWTALRRKIESLTKTPVEQFRSAIRSGDAD